MSSGWAAPLGGDSFIDFLIEPAAAIPFVEYLLVILMLIYNIFVGVLTPIGRTELWVIVRLGKMLRTPWIGIRAL